MPIPANIPELEKQLKYHFDVLRIPEKNWPTAYYYEQQPIYDVVIIGAGMAGLTAAAALRFKGVHNVALFDAAPKNSEGPWSTYARMQTLRSPKEITGPALGIPFLTFQAWYTANYGKAAWDKLDRIPRLTWHDYLKWYRQVLNIAVHNDTLLTQIQPIEKKEIPGLFFQLSFTQHKQRKSSLPFVYARHVVLATGMDGFGGPNIPDWAACLPKQFWQHSSEVIDFKKLQHQHIAVVGGGDSALDAAATALEHHARQVDLCIRSAGFAQINYWKAIGHSGHRHGFQAMNAKQKEALLGFLSSQGLPPARGTIERLSNAKNLNLHFNCTITKAEITQQSAHEKILLLTNHSPLFVDFLILGTGYVNKPQWRKELKSLLPYIRFFEANAIAQNLPAEPNSVPQLNPDFSFKEKQPGQCPALSQIYLFTHSSLLSVGKIAGDIPGISDGAQKLSQSIVAKLYKNDFKKQLQAVKDYDELEIEQKHLKAIEQLTANIHLKETTLKP